MEGLSFAQPAHVMETRIESLFPTAVALKATARLRSLFQQQDTPSVTGKDVSAFKPAQSAADNNHVIFHACFPFLS